MKKYIFCVCVLFSITSVAQEQSALCEDITKLTCAAGTHDDGTGTATTGEKDYIQITHAAFDAQKSDLKNSFEKIIADKDQNYFRKLAVSVTGLSDSPDCQSKEPSHIKTCNSNIVEGLLALSGKILVPRGSTATYQMRKKSELTPDLKDLYLLLQNDLFLQNVEKVQKEVAKKADQPEMERKIKDKIFPQVKTLMVNRIDQLPIDEAQKEAMKDKVKNIQFAGTDCSSLASGLSMNFVPNAMYSYTNKIYYCKGFIQNASSEFQIANIIAHELAHSIDPCLISMGVQIGAVKYKKATSLQELDSQYPASDLVSCLRTSKSLGARNFAHEQKQMMENGMYGGIVNPQGTTEKESTQYPGIGMGMGGYGMPTDLTFCGGDGPRDQIVESVCDWFAAEITPQYIEKNFPNLSTAQWRVGISNIFRGHCDEAEGYVGTHPTVQSRMNNLLLVNPRFREKMGCTKPHSTNVYCDAQNVASLRTIAEEDKRTKADQKKGVPAMYNGQPQIPSGRVESVK